MQGSTTAPSALAAGHGGAIVHSIGIAGIRVVRAPEKVRTVLGSCIGIAIYDRVAKVGGLGHVILPSSQEGSGDPGKFADTAVDLLVERITAEGGEPKRFAAKITGGAAMFGPSGSTNLGQRNAEAVRARLASHSIRLVAEDVGGTSGRKMLLDPATGDVQVEMIGQESRTI